MEIKIKRIPINRFVYTGEYRVTCDQQVARNDLERGSFNLEKAIKDNIKCAIKHEVVKDVLDELNNRTSHICWHHNFPRCDVKPFKIVVVPTELERPILIVTPEQEAKLLRDDNVCHPSIRAKS